MSSQITLNLNTPDLYDYAVTLTTDTGTIISIDIENVGEKHLIYIAPPVITSSFSQFSQAKVHYDSNLEEIVIDDGGAGYDATYPPKVYFIHCDDLTMDISQRNQIQGALTNIYSPMIRCGDLKVGDTDFENFALPYQYPDQTGKFLKTNGSYAVWDSIPTEIPSQSGNTDKFLRTNGSSVSWSALKAVGGLQITDSNNNNPVTLATSYQGRVLTFAQEIIRRKKYYQFTTTCSNSTGFVHLFQLPEYLDIDTSVTPSVTCCNASYSLNSGYYPLSAILIPLPSHNDQIHIVSVFAFGNNTNSAEIMIAIEYVPA